MTTGLKPLGTPVVAPNPVVFPGQVTVFFGLSAPAREVRLTVVTVANRKVIDIKKTGPFVPGNPSVKLDLVDAQGKPLSNGLYYFSVTPDGTARKLGKFVVLR
jgi:hypothetical protein